MLLQNKNVIIYGAGGSIGQGVATAYARQGARVFLTGRSKDALDELAGAITADGGRAEAAVVDALDERAVEEHLASVVASAGSVDVSLNLVNRGDVQGVPLTDMSTDDLLRAITVGMTTNFITARAAAKQMITQGSGVIIAVNSGSSHGSPMMGSTGPADAALDTFVRNLAQEIGPHGVRVVGMWIAGVPETLTAEKLAKVNSGMQLDETALRGVLTHLASLRITKTSPSLTQVADLATFLASDMSGALTGTFVNATSMFTS